MPDNPAYERLLAAQERRELARTQNDIPAWILAARDCGQGHFDLGDSGLAARLFSEAAKLIREESIHNDLLPEILGMSGRSFQRAKDFQRALQKYREAAEAASQLNSAVEQLRWMGKEASVLLDLEASFLQMLRDAGPSPSPQMQERIMGIRKTFQPESAFPKMKASVEFGKSQLPEADSNLKAELAYQLGRLAGRTRKEDPEEAKQLWRDAFTLLDDLPREESHFLAAINHALFLTDEKEFYSARCYLEEADEMALQLGFPFPKRLDVALRLGQVFRRAGLPGKAGDVLMDRLPHAQHPAARAELLTDATNAYFEGRLWEKMEASSRELMGLREQYFNHPQGLSQDDLTYIGAIPEGVFQIYMLSATALRMLGRNDEALDILKKAQDLARQGGNKQALHSSLGQAALSLLDEERYQESADIAGEMWNNGVRSELLARSYLKALIGLGDLDGAEAVRDDYHAYGDDRLVLAEFNALLADAGRGEPSPSWKAYWEAGEDRRDIGAVATALDHIIDIHPDSPDIRIEAAWRRLRLIEKVRPQVKDLFSEASWLHITPLFREFRGWLDRLLEEAVSLSDHGLAIYELERFRAQYLVNLLGIRKARWDPGQAGRLLDADRTELPGFIMLKGSETYSIKDRILSKIDYTHRVYRANFRFEQLAALPGRWQEKRDAARELSYWEGKAFHAGQLITTGNQSLAFPADLQEYLQGSELQPEEGFLFLHPLEEGTLAWLLDGTGELQHKKIESFGLQELEIAHEMLFGEEAEQGDRAMAWNRKEGAKPYSKTENLLKSLDGQLAIPIRDWLIEQEVKRAFIVSGTDLANLPLNACPAIFNAQITCCFLPSGHLLPFIRKNRRPQSEKLFLVDEEDRLEYVRQRKAQVEGKGLLLSDPTGTLSYAPLEAEAARLAAVEYQLQDAGSQPQKPDLARLAERVSWVHLISHGKFDENNPYRSGMYLAMDGDPESLWSVAEIFSEVEAPFGRLAVLSGCDTSRVNPHIVSEDISLPTAWLAAGYSAVIGSRWPVDDLSTALLMNRFFELWLKEGEPADRALDQSAAWLQRLNREQAASKIAAWASASGLTISIDSILEGDKYPFSHPRYWAAFFVAGDGSVRIKDRA